MAIRREDDADRSLFYHYIGLCHFSALDISFFNEDASAQNLQTNISLFQVKYKAFIVRLQEEDAVIV